MALDDKVIIKNELEPKAEGTILEFALHELPSRKKVENLIVTAYRRYLTREFGQRGDEISTALMEALINYFEHANKYDPNKKVYVQGWRTPSRVYFSVAGESETGFDPRKVYLTEQERSAHEKSPYRKRGHIMMNIYADYIQYDTDGKSMLMAFDLGKRVA